MKVRSNRISDLQHYYLAELEQVYDRGEAARLIKRIILEYTGLKSSDLVLQPTKTVSESIMLSIHFAVKRLKKHEPLQHILGKVEFLDLTFEVNSSVLIPRPETEEMVEMILRDNKIVKNLCCLDIGTGSGCIAVSLMKYLEKVVVYAIDDSAISLEIAQKNANRNNCEVHFLNHNILSGHPLNGPKSFNLIVSNPPYVMESEKATMSENVLNYEPSSALFVPDDNPLIYYKAIELFSRKYLSENGMIYLEINESLGSATSELFKSQIYSEVLLIKDMQGKERFLKVKK